MLGDPHGNELCVIEPENDFLADCGFVGALARDGSRQAGSSAAGQTDDGGARPEFRSSGAVAG